eukprot:GEMP01109897.1.p1 GENE.GEMP01109897.1~~GEMP01109897.1.p1  ORF type:complete len:103 (+),score=9.31 GEMP01109897.1:255-563(+)
MGFKLFGYWNAPHAADIALVSFIALTVLRFVIFPGPYAMRWTIIHPGYLPNNCCFYADVDRKSKTIFQNCPNKSSTMPQRNARQTPKIHNIAQQMTRFNWVG